jgi:hypothetical protein
MFIMVTDAHNLLAIIQEGYTLHGTERLVPVMTGQVDVVTQGWV